MTSTYSCLCFWRAGISRPVLQGLAGLFVAKQRKPVATTATLTLPLAHLRVLYSNFASCSKSAFFLSAFFLSMIGSKTVFAFSGHAVLI